ncbi:MAG: 4a-hydroxytetrahydrobiopterin dehydratase [Patescibacteria group bacterium]
MKKKNPYTKTELTKHLKKAKLDWSMTPKATQINKQFSFKDYLDAFMFVARVSVHAEILKHHPDIELSYGKVKVKLTTHDLKGVSKLDVDLAKRIEHVADRINARGKQKQN